LDDGYRALDLSPDSAEIQHTLAAIHGELGQIVMALNFLKSAVALEPNNATFWNSQASFQLLVGQIDQARVSAETALRIDEKHAATLNALSLILWIEGDIPEAIRLNRLANEYDPDDLDHRRYQIVMLLGAERDLEAAEFYRTMDAIFPGEAQDQMLGHITLLLAGISDGRPLAMAQAVSDDGIGEIAGVLMKTGYDPLGEHLIKYLNEDDLTDISSHCLLRFMFGFLALAYQNQDDAIAMFELPDGIKDTRSPACLAIKMRRSSLTGATDSQDTSNNRNSVDR